jgi:hypothetical protein
MWIAVNKSISGEINKLSTDYLEELSTAFTQLQLAVCKSG